MRRSLVMWRIVFVTGRRRHTRYWRDWGSDVCSSDLFHGRSLGALALARKAAYREPFEPLPGDVTFVPYGDVAALDAAVTPETAAVVLEPLQGEEIGRASCRERVSISVVAVSLQKNHT